MSASNSPLLSEQQTGLLETLSTELDHSGLLWASGYLAGRASSFVVAPGIAANTAPEVGAAAPVERPVLTVLYGSQTGNAKRIAEQLVAKAEAQGLDVRLIRADDYKVKDLKKEKLLYVVISTHSSGDIAEPPDDSVGFMEKLMGKRAPKDLDLSFAVLALGDTSYPDFCGVGRDIDRRLEELGGSRLFDRGEADVDIETISDPWIEEGIEQAKALQEQGAEPAAAAKNSVVTPLRPKKTAWSRQNPFQAEIYVNQKIVSEDSEKDVRHIELSLENSGLTYHAGDALGVWPTQSAELVAAVLKQLELDGAAEIAYKDETHTLQEWLTHYRELTVLTRPLIQAQAERTEGDALQKLLEPEQREQLNHLLNRIQLIDFLRDYPAQWTAEDLVASLRPLAPRMYSISSSQEEVDEEVHLTVELLRYQKDEEERFGVATQYLCGLEEGDTAPVFIDPNDRFRLPEDSSKDVIMIGPGTGVAPFRSFVQERAATDAEGRNWLFFGNPHRRSDFLYQVEWQKALKFGELDRLDVAFSRDQDHKIYVQDRIREKAQDVWEWLENGAHVYICGDADRMAPDVQKALVEVAVEQGGKSTEEAQSWFKEQMTQGRFARDVY